VRRRQFLAQSAALAAVPGAARKSEDRPMLRAISSWKASSPDVAYFFAFDSVDFYRNIEPEMRAASDAGFNTLYLIYHPYRSEDGGATPWQEHIPLNDPDFASAPPVRPGDREAEERTFRNILAACRKHRMKVMFDVGCWAPQKWYRENPEAASKLPDDTPQYDRIFEKSWGRRILAPCFRSRRFLAYSETVIRKWLQQYRKSLAFEDVLARVAITNRFEIRLDPQGAPAFFIHQDTIDRDWCHCSQCRIAFRDYLHRRFGDVAAINSQLLTDFASLEQVAIPLSPNALNRRRFAAQDALADPRHQRLWYEAARFWSEGIAAWRARLVASVREFYPNGEVLMISKYPMTPLLTDYPLIARDGKMFLMDSYPMETSQTWNLLRYFFEIEVYQSAAEQQGQALMAHLQAYENKLRNRPSRAPSPEEFRQQHVGLIARRVGATVTFTFDHKTQLSPGGRSGEYVPDAMRVNGQWNKQVEAIEQAYSGATRYRDGVVVRYNPLATCNPKGAAQAIARYRYWKNRGVPVSVLWDEKSAAETVPESFEFTLAAGSVGEMDLVVSRKDSGYVLALTNLAARSRDATVRVRLKGEDMSRWRARPVWGPPVAVSQSGDGELVCRASLAPQGAGVFALVKS
jgi:hypothetical protein